MNNYSDLSRQINFSKRINEELQLESSSYEIFVEDYSTPSLSCIVEREKTPLKLKSYPFFDKLSSKQHRLPSDIEDILNDNFWDL